MYIQQLVVVVVDAFRRGAGWEREICIQRLEVLLYFIPYHPSIHPPFVRRPVLSACFQCKDKQQANSQGLVVIVLSCCSVISSWRWMDGCVNVMLVFLLHQYERTGLSQQQQGRCKVNNKQLFHPILYQPTNQSIIISFLSCNKL